MNAFELEPIAHIESDFGTKFGIPRQSLLVEELKSRIIFEPAFRSPDALRGLDSFSHIWLIWQFSENIRQSWSPTVRPPRLGGNVRMGVFATRSPFRPNNLGLSCVKLDGITEDHNLGPVLTVSGADLMNGTPIFDIKPYLPYSDSIPDAKDSYAPRPGLDLPVSFENGTREKISPDKLEALQKVLSCDPRPRYQQDPDRVYGMLFAGKDIRFRVENGVLRVVDVI